MSKKSSRNNSRQGVVSPRKNKAVLIITLALICIVGTTILAQVNSRRKGKEASGEVSIQGFTAAKPTREMIYAGIRLVASEGGYSISPTYQSFAGNGSTAAATINVTAPSGAPWTAASNQSWVTITSGSSGTGNGTTSYSVAVNSGSVIRSTTITVNSQTFTVYQGINFTDVPSNHQFYDYIGRLAARGVTLGCGTGIYCPDTPVIHEQMSAFVIRALGMPDPPPPPSQRFADVPSSNVSYYAFIEQMGARGIWNGCGGGNYCPANAVLREQMAAIVMRSRGEFNPPTPPTQRFDDVPPTNQYYNFIDRMAVLGITLGCNASPPWYCPGDSVTRGQMAAFLVRAYNL